MLAIGLESVRDYIASHYVAIHVQHMFNGLSFASALWFAVVLTHVLRQAEREPGIFSTLALNGAALAVTVAFGAIGAHSTTLVESVNTVHIPSLLTAVVRELVTLEALP